MMSSSELYTIGFCCFVLFFFKQRNENKGMLTGFPFLILHRGWENMTLEH